MDIKAYIQSGIIEQYVLGLATPQEVAELELLRDEYPELKQAMLEVEESFEAEIFANKIEPPAALKSAIEKKLFNDDSAKAVVIENSFTPSSEKKSVSLLWRYIAAASIILLIGSTALNFYFYSSYKNSRDQYQALLSERNTLQANNTLYKSQLDSINQNLGSLQTNTEDYKDQIANLQQSFKILSDPDYKEVKLRGIPNKKHLASVYWNKETKQVYLFRDNMKEIPRGKQYQLWAIVDGKPVDAGLIGNCSGLCKMKIIPKAQAFAVTIEETGGSEKPTLTAMYVLGFI